MSRMRRFSKAAETMVASSLVSPEVQVRTLPMRLKLMIAALGLFAGGKYSRDSCGLWCGDQGQCLHE